MIYNFGALSTRSGPLCGVAIAKAPYYSECVVKVIDSHFRLGHTLHVKPSRKSQIRQFSRKKLDVDPVTATRYPRPSVFFRKLSNVAPGGGGGGEGTSICMPYWVCAARETPIFSPEFPFQSI